MNTAFPENPNQDISDKPQSFAGQIRSAFVALGPGEITTDRIAEAIGLEEGERKRLHTGLKDFVLRGEVERIGERTYRYINPTTPKFKKQVMWRLFRARRNVTLDDLQELAGASQNYAAEWLRNLVKIGVARKITKPGVKAVWQLIQDTVSDPETAENAKKLRMLRASKRAEEKLSEAKYALDRAKLDVESAIKDLVDARREFAE